MEDFVEVNLEEEKKDEPKTKFDKFFNVFTIFLIVLSIIVGGCGVFQFIHKSKYSFCFVNGQSMYPTLNKDAKFSTGELIGLIDVSSGNGNYDCDYGFFIENDSVRDNLKRFDLIVGQYNNEKIYVIKRVIAFPGETFYITKTTEGDEGNGNLYIKNETTGEFEFVPQPIDETIIHGGHYTDTFTVPTTLENEFFVMGDNRYIGNSKDSRMPEVHMYYSNVIGKLIGIEAHCSLKLVHKNGESELVVDQIHHFFPWRYF